MVEGMEDQVISRVEGMEEMPSTKFDEIFERLKSAAGTKTDKQFADYLRIQNQSVAGSKKRGIIPPGWIIQVAEKSGYSLDWLQFGIGPLRRTERAHAGEAGESFPSRCLEAEEYVMVPQLESRVTAGPEGEILYQDVAEYYPFKRWWVAKLVGRSHEHQGALILVRVRGDSMSPTIDQGEVALVDTHEAERLQVLNGRIYLIIQPDGAVALKRLVLAHSEGLYRLVCLSDNTAYRPFEFIIDPNKTLKHYILGRIRWAGKEFE